MFVGLQALKILFRKAEQTEMDQFIYCSSFGWVWNSDIPFQKNLDQTKLAATPRRWSLGELHHSTYFFIIYPMG
jgi:hypothetical protein